MSKIYNFSAGPCILPQAVFEEASQAVLNFNGLSILEISHRSKEFIEVMENARALVKEVLNVPEGYTVLFLQGGASLGFLMSAFNGFRTHKRGAYINTGTWAAKAIKEAKNAGGEAKVVGSSEDQNFNYIPKSLEAHADCDYLHYTSNNTIFGTQFKSVPSTDLPVICDMSSDIFSQAVDVSKFDLIYAGAQKNLGPAGTTLYIVKDSFLGQSSVNIPTMLDLNVHAQKDSMFNTPPVFSVYVSYLNLKWLKANGGIEWIAKRNAEKAQLLYDEIDRNPLFEGVAAKEDRSLMNPTFVLTDPALESTFNEMWNAAGISGIKGHRSVGGYRASMYNAMDIEGVQTLVNVMKELEKRG